MEVATTPNEPDRPESLLPIPTAQERLGGLSRTTIYRLMDSGELDYVKIGARRLIPESAIAEFIARRRAAHSGSRRADESPIDDGPEAA